LPPWLRALLVMLLSSAGCAAASFAKDARDCPDPGRSSMLSMVAFRREERAAEAGMGPAWS